MALTITSSRHTTLCTLPPECLLAIISYLSPNTFTPLIQTSHHFLAFFSTHASTICNTHILTHYHLSSSYFNSTYIDGWLVPSHPAVGIQEKHLLCPPALHIYSETLCGRILLSSPGPQYLLFLSQYDFEIRTRREMVDREFADADELPELKDGEKVIEVEDEVGEGDEQGMKRDEIEDRFTYMVGTYAIRGFLRKMDDFAGALEERRFSACLEEVREPRIGGKARVVRGRVGMKMNGVKRRLKSALKGLERKLRKEKRELCFGEIESDEETEKGGLERPLRDGGVAGLLWYYGDAGVLAFRKSMVRREVEGVKVEAGLLAENDGPREKRVDRVKFRVRKALGRMADVTACFGTKRHFESLD